MASLIFQLLWCVFITSPVQSQERDDGTYTKNVFTNMLHGLVMQKETLLVVLADGALTDTITDVLPRRETNIPVQVNRQAETLFRWLQNSGGVTIIKTIRSHSYTTKGFSERLASVILFVHLHEISVTQYGTILDFVEQSGARSSHALHFVMCLCNVQNGKEYATGVLTVFWRRKVYRAAVAVLNAGELEAWLWEPIGHGHDCGGPRSSAIKNTLSGSKIENIAKRLELSYMLECTLVLSPYPESPYVIPRNNSDKSSDLFVDGLEIRIIKEITKRMNIYFCYLNITPSYVEQAELVANGTSNLTAGCYFLLDKFYFNMDVSVSFWEDETRWFVPCDKPMPRWRSVFLVFTKRMWIFVSLSCAFMAFTFAVLKNACYDSVGAYAAPAPLVGVSLTKEPSGMIAGGVFIVWLLCCLVINAAYQSALISFLTDPGVVSIVSNVRDIETSGIDVGLIKGYMDFYDNYEDSLLRSLFSRANICEVFECLDRVAFSGDMALPMELSYVEYNYIGAGREMLKVIDKMNSFSIHTFFTKGSPLVQTWNIYLQRLIESSLTNVWWKEVMSKKSTLLYKTHKHKTKYPFALTLSHLQGPFFMLLLGILISTASFLIEYCNMRKIFKWSTQDSFRT